MCGKIYLGIETEGKCETLHYVVAGIYNVLVIKGTTSNSWRSNNAIQNTKSYLQSI